MRDYVMRSYIRLHYRHLYRWSIVSAVCHADDWRHHNRPAPTRLWMRQTCQMPVRVFGPKAQFGPKQIVAKGFRRRVWFMQNKNRTQFDWVY